MSGKWVVVIASGLFACIGVAAWLKQDKPAAAPVRAEQTATPVVFVSKATPSSQTDALVKPIPADVSDFPQIDRISQLFTTGPSKLPIVETVTYSSSVPWLKGRPAWIADYAIYYNTSRHFIARSLNGRPDYFTQTVADKSKFNVFKLNKPIQFHLLVDLSHCKMGFYYVDLDTNERVLLKTYSVGLGRQHPQSPSGSLTPLGEFKLGNKVAIYQPGVKGFYHGKEVEMIQVFGTRWLPMIPQGVADAHNQGYGLQGVPVLQEGVESLEGVGAYSTDGCIRLKSADIEEIFSIVVSKPTFVHVVPTCRAAKLPGIEVATPSR